MLAEKYNDSTFIPMSIAMPYLHSAFKHSLELSLEGCPDDVTPEQVKERLSDSESKMNLILANYEQSGMGEGHKENNSDKISILSSGSTDSSTSDDNDNKLDFIDGNDKLNFLGLYWPHILYYWQLMEDNKLLKNCNVCLKSGGVSLKKAADTSSSSNTTNQKNKLHQK